MIDDRHHREAEARGTDALTRLLRDTDPAAGEAGLDAVQRARMRQSITETAGRHASGHLWSDGWQGWRRPALAAATLITVAGLAWWTLDGTPEMTSRGAADTDLPTPQPTPEPTAKLAPATQPVQQTPSPTPEIIPEPDETPALIPMADPAAVAAAATAPPETTVAVAADDPSPPDRKARTVQFTAPRGTRIIWTLDPDFESPIAGQEPRQERQ